MNKEIIIKNYINHFKEKILVGVQQVKKPVNYKLKEETFMFIIHMIKKEKPQFQD